MPLQNKFDLPARISQVLVMGAAHQRSNFAFSVWNQAKVGPNQAYKARNLKIEKVKSSRIGQVDFDNLSFGTVFTDHMFVCNYVDGMWQTPEIKPYQPLVMDVAPKTKI